MVIEWLCLKKRWISYLKVIKKRVEESRFKQKGKEIKMKLKRCLEGIRVDVDLREL